MKPDIKKLFTILLVLVLAMNIETLEFALFINMVGIDMFLLLIQAQILAWGVLSFNTTIKPVINFFLGFSNHPFIIPSRKQIKADPGSLAFMFPTGAILIFSLTLMTIASVGRQLLYFA